jgi:hypothetical protein
MSKMTRRTWRKTHDRLVVARTQSELDRRERLLRGFKPASTGDMLAAVSEQRQRRRTP